MSMPEDNQQPSRIHHIPGFQLAKSTAQSSGMRRLEAISGVSTGSRKIWMGESHIGPSTRSDNHHHGESETGIYVLSGNPVFVFLQDNEETRITAQPGDYIFVPPYVAHREENPSEEEDAVVILARSTQEAIVVNLPSLE